MIRLFHALPLEGSTMRNRWLPVAAFSLLATPLIAAGLAFALAACAGVGVPDSAPTGPPPSGIIALSPLSSASSPMWVGHGESVLVKVSEAYYLGAFAVSGGSAGCFSVAMQDATTVVVTSTPVTIYGCVGSFTVGDSLGHSHTGYVEVSAIFGP